MEKWTKHFKQISLDMRPPAELFLPIQVPQKLLMGPGPSNCSTRVLAAASQPLIGYLHPELLKIMSDIKAGIHYVFQTTNPYTLAISGTGHCAIEAAVFNLLQPGEKLLIAVHGIWGQRVADIAERCGANTFKVFVPVGEVFSLEELEKALVQYRPNVLSICHGDSSTGTLQPLENLGELCHRYECLLMVDAVASLGGTPIFMDKWEMFNFRYHHTAPITGLYTLREALAQIVEEGLEHCWQRHQQCAELLYEGLENLGLELLVKKKENRLPTVTTVKIPSHISGKKVTDFCMKEYSLEIAGGLGPTAGKVWRIGLMGNNCKPQNVSFVLTTLKQALAETGFPSSKL
ncbi:serine--pyruvate aminotransferase, mitochondrial-like [Limulus polyphemus]|uniref:Alanine--glyoxylate aminotransferase n=1 Tax=Limulus polyphemus TaxID=6850 RepID=A0ABM1TD04_LIMPO|nr:serine--pyruvate aminotransferase, mitochondrial-like [Limulus polyphemus]